MAGQGTLIIASDYNLIQKKIAAVLGAGGTNPDTDAADATFGYGNTVDSSQVSQYAKVSNTQWANLRNDILRCRYHQGYDASVNLTTPATSVKISEADRAAYLAAASDAISNRLASPPTSQISQTPTTAKYIYEWNTLLTETFDVTFASATAARQFFNAGGFITFTSSRLGGTETGQPAQKNATWTTMLNTMGEIKINYNSTTKSGTGPNSGTGSNIGWYQLSTAGGSTGLGQLIYEQVAPSGPYSDNKYRIYAKLANSAQITFTVQWRDDSPNPNPTMYGVYGPFGSDEKVDGTLTSTITINTPSGAYVTCPTPTGTLTGSFSAAPSPAPTPVYIISPSVTAISEGGTVVYTVTTANVANSTVLYWTNSGTTGTADFSDTKNDGTVTINSNAASFSRTITADFFTEGDETIVIELRTGSKTGPIVATATSVLVLDSSKTLSYSIVPDNQSLNEGDTVTYTITATNFGDGILYWKNVGTTSASDFSDNQNSGSINISNSSATFTRTMALDLTTESGAETVIIQLFPTAISTSPLASSAIVNVQDTSTTPPTTYSITPNVATVVEGADVIYTVRTTNWGTGTGTLYWSIGLAGVTTSDFTGGITTGSVAISGNTGQFTITVSADLTTEGTESFTVYLRTGSPSGSIIATASSVTITDSSVTPPTPPASYSISTVTNFTANTITEDTGSNTATITITTTNVANGTVLYWGTFGTVGAGDFADNALTGSVTVSGGTAQLTRVAIVDNITEGQEYFYIQFALTPGGTVVCGTPYININDTSTDPAGTVVLTSPSTSYSYWTIPSGVNALRITVIGAGGPGGSGYSSSGGSRGGGGGGGGGMAQAIVDSSAATSVAWKVGYLQSEVGPNQSSQSSAGFGGVSLIGEGGGAGVAGTSGAGGGTGGAGGIASLSGTNVSTTNRTTQTGIRGFDAQTGSGTAQANGGAGGQAAGGAYTSYAGTGGNGGTTGFQNGINGNPSGGGGGGGGGVNTVTAGTGGNGAAGGVIIEYGPTITYP